MDCYLSCARGIRDTVPYVPRRYQQYVPVRSFWLGLISYLEKNNERHLGVIRTSNLCTEIVQHSSREQTAVCTLASIAAPRFVLPDGGFDLRGLHKMTKLAVLGTDALIDAAWYPTKAVRASALKTRAIGVGVQGLANVFKAMRLPFASGDARALNVEIFETIYHASYEASCDLAATHGTYPLYPGSPASTGELQHDMWSGTSPTGRYDFDALRARIAAHGLRNSMLTAQMPTASTARLLGNSEGVEPYTRYVPCTSCYMLAFSIHIAFRSNILIHRILSGDYPEVCPWLVRELHSRGIWSEDLRLSLLRNHGSFSQLISVVASASHQVLGSIQDIASVPDDVKNVYKTTWEIDPLAVIDMAADRGPFIDQTQSMSLNITRPSPDYLVRDHLCARLQWD